MSFTGVFWGKEQKKTFCYLREACCLSISFSIESEMYQLIMLGFLLLYTLIFLVSVTLHPPVIFYTWSAFQVGNVLYSWSSLYLSVRFLRWTDQNCVHLCCGNMRSFNGCTFLVCFCIPFLAVLNVMLFFITSAHRGGVLRGLCSSSPDLFLEWYKVMQEPIIVYV